MAPHDVGLSFDLDLTDIEAGIRKADRMLKPRILEVLDVTANAIARRARARHGYIDRTGALTKSIHAGEAFETGKGAAVEVIADAPYAAAQEYGARPHVIRAKPGKTLRFFAGGQLVFRKAVNHPGNMGQGFLLDAMFAELEDTTDRVAAYASDVFHDAGFL